MLLQLGAALNALVLLLGEEEPRQVSFSLSYKIKEKREKRRANAMKPCLLLQPTSITLPLIACHRDVPRNVLGSRLEVAIHLLVLAKPRICYRFF